MNAAIVRRLMNDAFSSGEIDTLVFDYFYPLYGDIESTSPKTAKIQALVEWCEQNDQLPKLGQCIQRMNPNQFARYERMWKAGQL